MSRQVAEYCVNQHFNNKRYRKFFRYTLIPDEMYIHTILLNSQFANSCINNDLRDIEWDGGDGTHPIIFKAEDIDRFKASPDLFARKFDTTVDSKILDLIDKEILNK
ncbi:MAG: beta-1,6-N-acetylglucosaminyltransferase [Sphingobacteriales bacterium JAD_PAG50586_3]|nr:MAG: beta-1,6-N-acetylglucosaminyltransferase [Sphingobacteriales bacterium JAD_PAG50586_3]